MWLQPIIDKLSDLRICVGMRYPCRLGYSEKVVVLSVVCLLCLSLLVRIVFVAIVDKLADQRVWVCMCVQPIVDKLVDQSVSACLRFPYD